MQRIRAVAVFLFVSLVVAIPAFWAHLRLGRIALHAAVNEYNWPWADVFFKYSTHIADGWTVVIVCIIVLMIHTWRSFLMLAISTILSATITQFLKRSVFPENDRPSMFRDQWPDIHWVQGVVLHSHFSFPSGHSTAAFSMCLALAVIVGKQGWAAILAMVAVVLGFSRVYLSQHFTQDVFAGAIVGIVSSLIVYYALYRGKWAHREGLDRGLMRKGPR
ncbi:MAG: phosphatase PAP2 family protein [Flavobacteriales bacterium]|nr:phosphatase PAP2 family protein [Flavobacteriales bacterium]